MKTPAHVLVIVAILLISGIVPAAADSLSTTFTVPGLGASGLPAPPWGTLALDLNPDASIHVAISMAAGLGLDFFAFSSPVSDAGFSVAGLPSGWSLEGVPSGGCSFPADFGTFDACVVTAFGVGPESSLSFDISNTPAGGFSSVFQLVELSSSGSPLVHFAAHVISAAPSADVGALVAVPEPAALALVALGLFGLSGARRWLS